MNSRFLFDSGDTHLFSDRLMLISCVGSRFTHLKPAVTEKITLVLSRNHVWVTTFIWLESESRVLILVFRSDHGGAILFSFCELIYLISYWEVCI